MNKRFLIVFGLVMALALVVAGTAFAQGPLAQGANPAFVDEDGDGVCDVCGGTPGTGTNGRRGGGMGPGRSDEWRQTTLLSVVADVTGLTQQEIWEALQSGQTFTEIIEGSGNSVDDVVAAFLAARKAVLDQWLADGTITQLQYDTMLANMEAQVRERLTSNTGCGAGTGKMGPGRGSMPGRGGRRGGQMPGYRMPQRDTTTTSFGGRVW